MDKLKKIWKRQDFTNKVILLSGTVAAIVCLVMGEGRYSLVFVVLMGMFAVAHIGQRTKRLSRLYGTFYFHMPDGEIYPMTFEQVKAEYLKGAQGRYAGRKVSVWYPYRRGMEDNKISTGFGLDIDLDGFDDPDGLLGSLKNDEFIYVTGEILAKRRDYFCVGNVTELRRQEKRP